MPGTQLGGEDHVGGSPGPLFDPPVTSRARLQREFDAFHAANPEVYQLFTRFALEARAAGHKHLSADMVAHRVRWETSVATRGDHFKLNNNHVAFYARLFMADHPALRDFFRTRDSVADGRSS